MPHAFGVGHFFALLRAGGAARRRAGLCGKENLYTNSIIITIDIFCPCGRQCTGPGPMPEGLWAAAASWLGAAPAAGSGKGGRKCQRRAAPLAVNSAGHWGSTGGRGTHWRKETAPAAGGPRAANGAGHWGIIHGENGASGGKQSPWRRAGAFAQFLVYWQQNTCGRGHRAKLRPVPAHRAGPGAALGAGGAAAGLLAAMHWRRGGAHTAKGGKAQ